MATPPSPVYMSAISLIVQYLTNLGLLAQGGILNTYVGGSASTPVTTYTDSSAVVQNPNPMQLNSAGRPAAAGQGAQVAFWVPGGTLVKLVVTDAAGNQLVYLDNVPAINDLTGINNALAALLLSPASSNAANSYPVAGADLVANAVKSYDVFADVRAASPPGLAAGQTLNIEVQGGLQVADSLGGFFYWNSTSTTADDGRTVLKANALASFAQGRWIRYYPLGVPFSIVKPTDQTVTSSVTPALDNTLVCPLLGGATYLVQMRLQLAGVGATGMGYIVQPQYTGTLNASEPNTGGGSGSSGGTPAALACSVNGSTTGAAALTTGDFVNLDLLVHTNAAGTFGVAFAQNSSSSNAIAMKAGSTLIVTRIN